MPTVREDLGKLTVAALRDLAKKRLGPGTSKLRTKAQLVDALAAPRSKAQPRKAAATAPAKKSKPVQSKRPSARALATTPVPAAKAAPKAAPKPARTPDPVGRAARVKAIPAIAAPRAATAEPLLALPLDDQTLLIRWGSVTAAEKGQRWEVEITGDGHPTRTVQVAPQARQAHVRALPRGPVYRAKLVAREADGRRRLIRAPSRPVVFFPKMEPVAGERFVQYSWADPAGSSRSVPQAPPGSPLEASEGAALAEAAEGRSAGRAVTSPSGSLAGPALGWLVSSRRPTSFAN